MLFFSIANTAALSDERMPPKIGVAIYHGTQPGVRSEDLEAAMYLPLNVTDPICRAMWASAVGSYTWVEGNGSAYTIAQLNVFLTRWNTATGIAGINDPGARAYGISSWMKSNGWRGPLVIVNTASGTYLAAILDAEAPPTSEWSQFAVVILHPELSPQYTEIATLHVVYEPNEETGVENVAYFDSGEPDSDAVSYYASEA
ncbi:MAG TPA: hypothetical protein P5080_01140 [Candidatus Paceibacterota bacterium]|nr:hypothetical protein [Candidatus Pacearchaeota archaeon]HRZ50578.1 hypothetical protein [Candidatus Paceibacterota bacterium]HSA36299.1 hypothetical protein [Candidatus Paceibacterota bacterium]